MVRLALTFYECSAQWCYRLDYLCYYTSNKVQEMAIFRPKSFSTAGAKRGYLAPGTRIKFGAPIVIRRPENCAPLTPPRYPPAI